MKFGICFDTEYSKEARDLIAKVTNNGKGKIRERLSEHLKQHRLMYFCQFIFLTVSIIICIFAYALIIGKQECKEDGSKDPVAVKVFINENDTIIPALSAEIRELKEMMQKMQDDTLCVTITKGNK